MRDKRRSASVVIETDPEDALDIDQDEVEEVSPTLISPTLEGRLQPNLCLLRLWIRAIPTEL